MARQESCMSCLSAVMTEIMHTKVNHMTKSTCTVLSYCTSVVCYNAYSSAESIICSARITKKSLLTPNWSQATETAYHLIPERHYLKLTHRLVSGNHMALIYNIIRDKRSKKKESTSCLCWTCSSSMSYHFAMHEVWWKVNYTANICISINPKDISTETTK